jgi:DNA adenine methylase
MSYNKPILKWVGGKTQIIDKIMDEFPCEINNYHELFLGGGSVLIELLHKIDKGDIKVKGKIYAYDINEVLINIYKHIQNNCEIFYNKIKKIVDEYKSCNDAKGNDRNKKPTSKTEALTSRESYYYWIRKEYNSTDKNSMYSCVLFLFLNKTCFRGLYRVGPNGFNVPYGNYKNPEIVNYEHLQYLSKLIKNVEFICSDFTKSFEKIVKDDFCIFRSTICTRNKNIIC